jgi:hypothetical protein
MIRSKTKEIRLILARTRGEMLDVPSPYFIGWAL